MKEMINITINGRVLCPNATHCHFAVIVISTYPGIFSAAAYVIKNSQSLSMQCSGLRKHPYVYPHLLP